MQAGQADISHVRLRNLLEIGAVSAVAALVIIAGWWAVGDALLARQLVVWVANIMMLLTIWACLRRRGQTWASLGLAGISGRARGWLRTFLQSLAVFIVALIAFGLGSVVAVMIFGEQAQADMSSYEYLVGNLPVFLLALLGVFVASSFGEEAIYRGFLITRVGEMFAVGKRASVIAVAVSAIVFGLIHFGWGPVGIVQTTFMGLALAVSYLLLGRNLWPLVIAHAYLDTMLLVPVFLGPGAG